MRLLRPRMAQIVAQENGARDQQKTTTDAAADQQNSRATAQEKTAVQHLDNQITALKKQHDAELGIVENVQTLEPTAGALDDSEYHFVTFGQRNTEANTKDATPKERGEKDVVVQFRRTPRRISKYLDSGLLEGIRFSIDPFSPAFDGIESLNAPGPENLSNEHRLATALVLLQDEDPIYLKFLQERRARITLAETATWAEWNPWSPQVVEGGKFIGVTRRASSARPIITVDNDKSPLEIANAIVHILRTDLAKQDGANKHSFWWYIGNKIQANEFGALEERRNLNFPKNSGHGVWVMRLVQNRRG